MNDLSKRVLFYDIEVAPNIAMCYAPYKGQVRINQDNIIRNSFIACISYKFAGDKKVRTLKCSKDTESEMLHAFSKVVDQASEVVAHNGDKFDIRVINSRTLHYGLPSIHWPPSTDTLKLTRRKFYLNSYALSGLAKYYTKSRKGHNIDWEEWYIYWSGPEHKRFKAIQRELVKYCEQDVLVLEELYNKIRHYTGTSVHKGAGVSDTCPNCGSKKLHKNGTYMSKAGIEYIRLRCRSCEFATKIRNREQVR